MILIGTPESSLALITSRVSSVLRASITTISSRSIGYCPVKTESRQAPMNRASLRVGMITVTVGEFSRDESDTLLPASAAQSLGRQPQIPRSHGHTCLACKRNHQGG